MPASNSSTSSSAALPWNGTRVGRTTPVEWAHSDRVRSWSKELARVLFHHFIVEALREKSEMWGLVLVLTYWNYEKSNDAASRGGAKIWSVWFFWSTGLSGSIDKRNTRSPNRPDDLRLKRRLRHTFRRSSPPILSSINLSARVVHGYRIR